MMNKDLPEQLRARLAEPLPGPMVGSRYEPNPRPWRRDDVVLADARQAAVLVLLFPHLEQWWLPLMLRPGHLTDHAGQISLPGGAVEPGETAVEAAVREFHEELGDEGQQLDILGTLSPLYVYVSRFLITPCVAVAAERPRYEPNPAEVERLIEAPLRQLIDPEFFGAHARHHQGQPYTAPHFLIDSHQVWGATCMILGELATILDGLKIDDC
jgi:8-oxo-dGTP pyrophosphatase MutT (NUDIX family)